MDAHGILEKDMLYGISEKREDAEYFIGRLWKGGALPVELTALYDDFISEKEWQEENSVLAACWYRKIKPWIQSEVNPKS